MARRADNPNAVARVLERAAVYSAAMGTSLDDLRSMLRNGGSAVLRPNDSANLESAFYGAVTDAVASVNQRDKATVEIAIRGEIVGAPAALKNLSDDVEEVRFVIDSTGGSIKATNEIAALVGNRRAAGHVDGFCLSAAVDLLQRCERRTATKGSLLMIHRASTVVAGGVRELEAAIADITSAEIDFHRLLVARTGQPASVVSSWLESGDHYFSADSALEAGLLDEVL